MIRKFNEYFNTSLKDILSYEDVEDQFLRLKEVFNCDIKIEFRSPVSDVPLKYQAYKIQIRFGKNFTDEMKDELLEIKRRICDMFPEVSVGIFDIVELPERYYKTMPHRFIQHVSISLK